MAGSFITLPRMQDDCGRGPSVLKEPSIGHFKLLLSLIEILLEGPTAAATGDMLSEGHIFSMITCAKAFPFCIQLAFTTFKY